MNNYIYGPTTWSEPWPSAPFTSARLWDTYTEWRYLQPTAITWNWSNLDWWLNQAHTHNIDLIYTFGGVPQWASSEPGNTNCHRALTSGAIGSCAPPTNLTLWDNFVRAVVTHAAGRIKYWEIWNEPNIQAYWTGTPEQLATMAQHANSIIKSIDPSAIVISPSPSGYCYNGVCQVAGTSDGPTWLANFISSGGNSYVDVYAFHGYPGNVAEWINGYMDHYNGVLTNAGITSKNCGIPKVPGALTRSPPRSRMLPTWSAASSSSARKALHAFTGKPGMLPETGAPCGPRLRA